jgi:hypothetical protein
MGTIQIDGSTPKLTIGNATAEDALILFDGNAQDFYIGLDDSADDLIIGLGSAVGTTPAISINEDRDVTISDGAIDFDIASHDTSNGLKLGGTLVTATAAELNIMDGVTSTAAELNMVDGSAKSTSSITVADADGIIIIDGTTTKQIPASDLKTYAGFTATTITGTTALAETPALDDEAIISDAGTLKRLDIQHLLGAPAFSVWTNDQDISHQSWTAMAWDAERFDNSGNFDSSTNYRFTCPSTGNGRYFFIWKATIPNLDDGEEVQTRLRVSGSSPDPDITQTWVYQGSGASDRGMTVQATLFCNLTSGNYVDTQIYHNEGATKTMTGAQWTGWKMSGGTPNASDNGF